MLLPISLAVIGSLAVIVAAIAEKIDAASRRVLLQAVTAIAVLTAAGVVWEIAAWKSFSRNSETFRGIIASPRPGASSYVYTVRGHDYESWGFKVPTFSITTMVLLTSAVSIIRSIRQRCSGMVAVGVVVVAIILLGLFTLVSGYYYLIATDFFI